MIFPLNMVFFQSYVSLPECTIIVGLVGPQAASPSAGNGSLDKATWFFQRMFMDFPFK